MSKDHSQFDGFRRGLGPIPEHVIDEFTQGRLSRRDLLRTGSLVGLSIPLLGGIFASPASASQSSVLPGRVTGKPGAHITMGTLVPTGALDPLHVGNTGGNEMLCQTGEMLVFTDEQNNNHPWLATSWSPNADASVWTFKIRQGVKFNDGTPMTVDDVVYSFKSQCDPKNSGNALTYFAGVLAPHGVVKVDAETIAFHLEQPYGAFPYIISSANYNMIIVPKNYDYANWQKTFIGTGAFKNTHYNPSTGATFVRNPHYWGKQALPSKVDFVFYASEPPMVAALQAGSLDAIFQFSAAVSPQLLNGNYNVINFKSAANRQLSMRCDTAPFKSKYVRQAIAYTLDRPAIVKALFKGYAKVGNDNPFAPVFLQTNASVPQRKQNIRLAKELLAKGGVPRGFSASLFTEQIQEIPELAQIVKQSAALIGVDINLTIESQTKYYGNGAFGQSDWLDGQMSICDYGGRPVPNLYLQGPLQTINAKTGSGSWNAAHFSNSTYDALSKEYIGAADLSVQRKLAGKIEKLLLDETPIIFPYFYNYLAASQKNVTGIYPLAANQLYLWNAAKS